MFALNWSISGSSLALQLLCFWTKESDAHVPRHRINLHKIARTAVEAWHYAATPHTSVGRENIERSTQSSKHIYLWICILKPRSPLPDVDDDVLSFRLEDTGWWAQLYWQGAVGGQAMSCGEVKGCEGWPGWDRSAACRLFLLVHICIPVFLIAAGYFTAIASAVYGISNQNIEAGWSWL